MLKLGLDLSLSSIRQQGAWSPDDESSLVAWYQNKVGLTVTEEKVSRWDDSSTNSYDMVQGTAENQPTYTAETGEVTFDPDNTENLQSSQISLTGDFTIGVRLNQAAAGGILLGDNDATGEFFRFFSTTIIRIKIDNATAVDITKDSGTFLGDGYLVLTRVSNLITLNWDGTAQADTETLSGTADIDAIGIRKTDLNPYDGAISEIQIYSSSSATLTANVNDRLGRL
tara:strand:+ start:101 stop:781 length:681 start_codon:yes stop_codon:yes gene_type:complete